jgi:hypothetical protein
MRTPWIALIFGALAATFLLLALVDLQRHGSRATPARKTWFRIALVFACVSIYLLFSQGHSQP